MDSKSPTPSQLKNLPASSYRSFTSLPRSSSSNSSTNTGSTQAASTQKFLAATSFKAASGPSPSKPQLQVQQAPLQSSYLSCSPATLSSLSPLPMSILAPTAKKVKDEEEEAEERCQAHDIPVREAAKPLPGSITLKRAGDLDKVFLTIVGLFKDAEINKPRGVVRAKSEHDTEIKVSAIRLENSKFALQFNRLDGCVFTFQRDLLKIKLAISDYFEGAEPEKLKAELASAESRLKSWHGDDEDDGPLLPKGASHLISASSS